MITRIYYHLYWIKVFKAVTIYNCLLNNKINLQYLRFSIFGINFILNLFYSKQRLSLFMSQLISNLKDYFNLFLYCKHHYLHFIQYFKSQSIKFFMKIINFWIELKRIIYFKWCKTLNKNQINVSIRISS